MKSANSLMSSLGTTVFEVMSALAREHKSVNLGQGFPDDKGPDEVRAAAAWSLLGRGEAEPLGGTRTASPDLEVGFFAQHQIEDLQPDETPIAHVRARRPGDRRR